MGALLSAAVFFNMTQLQETVRPERSRDLPRIQVAEPESSTISPLLLRQALLLTRRKAPFSLPYHLPSADTSGWGRPLLPCPPSPHSAVRTAPHTAPPRVSVQNSPWKNRLRYTAAHTHTCTTVTVDSRSSSPTVAEAAEVAAAELVKQESAAF